MPYVKPSTTDRLRRLLNCYELNRGRRLAAVIDVSPNTAIKRIETPEDLTVRELRLLASKGHIPIDEIRGCL